MPSKRSTRRSARGLKRQSKTRKSARGGAVYPGCKVLSQYVRFPTMVAKGEKGFTYFNVRFNHETGYHMGLWCVNPALGEYQDNMVDVRPISSMGELLEHCRCNTQTTPPPSRAY